MATKRRATLTISDNSDKWEETYIEGDKGSFGADVEDPAKWAEALVDQFNRTRTRYEMVRKLEKVVVDTVEVVEETPEDVNDDL